MRCEASHWRVSSVTVLLLPLQSHHHVQYIQRADLLHQPVSWCVTTQAQLHMCSFSLMQFSIELAYTT